jgi:hypothetical protein
VTDRSFVRESGDAVQTVQLQCGSCGNRMAISLEHLGAQVQCPHCRAVVQTPPASAFGAAGSSAPPPAPTEPAPAPSPRIAEPGEDIFSEGAPSEDLFGEPTHPQVMMPEEPRPAPAPVPQPVAAIAPRGQAAEVLEQADDEEETADLAGMQARVHAARRASSLAPMILVFLVPYALCCTAFIGYLLYNWPTVDRLDYLPDPKRDGVRRTVLHVPAHDSPLAADRKVPLKETVRIGDMEITPLRIVRSGDDLRIEFRARNASTNLIMMPIDYELFNYNRKAAAGSVKPYTFLEGIGQPERVYGGHLEFFQSGREVAGELAPGQEEVVRLMTEQNDRARVNALLASNGRYLWRLQVRRGFINYRGSVIPATAVVGVEFTGQDVVREQG